MKSFCFILIFASFGISLAVLKNASDCINRTGLSEAAHLNCTSLDELNFGLKLLKLHYYDPTVNQVFSPLALKLSLLGIASASIGFDDAQAKAIYSALYDNVHDFPGYDGGLGYSQNKTTNASSVVRSVLDETKLEQLLSSNVETTTQQLPESHKVFYMNKTYKDMTKASEDEWMVYDNERKPRTQEELDLWLCISFDETITNETILGECLERVKSDDNKFVQAALQLSIRQNIELCRSFGVKNYFNCLQLIDTHPQIRPTNIDKDIFGNIDQMHECTSATAWQLARTHENIMHQLLFVNDSFFNVEDHQWKSNLNWYGLKLFDLNNETQVNQWKQFKRNFLSGLLLHEFVKFASLLTSQRNNLLDIVMNDLKFADKFTIGKRNFYGPKYQTNRDEEQIFQIETLINFGNKFSVVQHMQYRDGVAKNHTLIALPYEDHRFSLVLALPDKNSTVKDMLQGLTSGQLEHYFRSLQTSKRKIAHLTFPRFSISGKANVSSLLLPLNFTNFNLAEQNGKALSISLPLENVQQLIQVTNFGADEKNSDMSTLDIRELFEKNIRGNLLRFDRPFMYMLVSKRLDLLTRKRSFDILVTGFYNGPEHMLGL